jgi:succinate dehydrogenase / fumarate reductase, cytochrome b subunit
MAILTDFYRSLVGKKIVMAVTGAFLLFFVLLHLLGDLLIFLGAGEMNSYAAFLKSTGELLWILRLVLLVSLVFHILVGIQLTVANLWARPIPYLVRNNLETNLATRTMIFSGPLILVYVIYHLMMFTFLTTGPGYSETDVYSNTVQAFQVPAISAVYMAAMLVLGFHLFHGVWSMFQTFGVQWSRARRGLAWGVTTVIVLGYVSIPLLVLLGIVRL